jgi:hypothetical protein
MDLKRLTGKAKELAEQRGGPDSLKRDAQEVRRIFGGEGSLTDKAKAAAEALRSPGAGAASAAGAPAACAEPAASEAAPHRERPGRADRPGRRGRPARARRGGA